MVKMPAPNQLGLFGKSRATWAKLRHEFDIRFYEAQCKEPLTLEDGLSHYLNIGWLHGFDPNRNFSTKDYLKDNRDVVDSGINPLVHFVRHGRSEGRKATPSSFIEGQIQRLFGRASNFIAFVTTELQIVANSGGIGAAIEEQARCAVRAGFKVAIFYVDYNPSFSDTRLNSARNKLELESIALELVSYKKFAGAPAPIARSYAVYESLLEHESQIIKAVFSEYQGLGFHVAQAKTQGAFFSNTEILTVLHGSTRWVRERENLVFEHEDQLIQDFLERMLVDTSDLVVSPSQYLANYYISSEWITSKDKIIHLKNPVSELDRKKTIPEKNKSHKSKNLVFIGKENSKGLTTFCRSLSMINDEITELGMNVTFLGLSSGAASLHTLNHVEGFANGWEFNWNVYPRCNRSSVRRLLGHLVDPIVIVASQFENCPYAVLDALIDGYRTISSSSGGGPELYCSSTKTNFLFEANNPLSLAEKIRNLIINNELRPAISPDVKTANQGWMNIFTSNSPKSSDLLDPKTDKLLSVTIGITHYNRLSLLSDAVESALNQDYVGKIEVIVVDDGTPESNEKQFILDALSQRGVRVLNQKNSYLGAARNYALREASGDLVLFLDDDDILIPSAISSMVRSMLNTNASVVCAQSVEMNQEDRAFVTQAPERFVTRAKTKWFQIGGPISLISRRNLLGTATAMFRRIELTEIGGYSELFGVGFEDFEILVKYLIQKKKVVVYPDPLFAYQIGAPSMLSSTQISRNYKRVLDQLKTSCLDAAFTDLIELDAGETARKNDQVSKQKLESIANLEVITNAYGSFETSVAQQQALQDALSRLNLFHASESVRRGKELYLRAELDQESYQVKASSKLNASIISLKLLEQANNSSNQIVDEILTSKEKFSIQDQRNFLDIDWPKFVQNERQTDVMERFVAGTEENLASNDMETIGLSILAYKFCDIESMCEGFLNLIQLEENRYLESNPDIKSGIPNWFQSGFEHFVNAGIYEERNGFRQTQKLLSLILGPQNSNLIPTLCQIQNFSNVLLGINATSLDQFEFEKLFRHTSHNLSDFLSSLVQWQR